MTLEGPPPPPWFVDNGMGPQTPLGLLAWLVPDSLYGHNVTLAGRHHDWAYSLIHLIRSWRGGNAVAADELLRYQEWLNGDAWPVERLDITRADADRWLRQNMATLLRADGAGRLLCWRAPWLYWLGVRLGGGPAA